MLCHELNVHFVSVKKIRNSQNKMIRYIKIFSPGFSSFSGFLKYTKFAFSYYLRLRMKEK